MTITSGAGLLATDGLLVQLAVTAALGVIFLEREMVRHRSSTWTRDVGPMLFANAVPLAAAWALVAAQRFILLLTP